jgi:hypothetical protein
MPNAAIRPRIVRAGVNKALARFEERVADSRSAMVLLPELGSPDVSMSLVCMTILYGKRPEVPSWGMHNAGCAHQRGIIWKQAVLPMV